MKAIVGLLLAGSFMIGCAGHKRDRTIQREVQSVTTPKGCLSMMDVRYLFRERGSESYVTQEAGLYLDVVLKRGASRVYTMQGKEAADRIACQVVSSALAKRIQKPSNESGYVNSGEVVALKLETLRRIQQVRPEAPVPAPSLFVSRTMEMKNALQDCAKTQESKQCLTRLETLYPNAFQKRWRHNFKLFLSDGKREGEAFDLQVKCSYLLSTKETTLSDIFLATDLAFRGNTMCVKEPQRVESPLYEPSSTSS